MYNVKSTQVRIQKQITVIVYVPLIILECNHQMYSAKKISPTLSKSAKKNNFPKIEILEI